ncbi:hypothetical protein ACLB1O_17615 [Escherichia coli]
MKFKADFSTGQATLEVDGSTPVANDNDAFTLTATVKDQNTATFCLALWSSLICLGVKPLADGNITG